MELKKRLTAINKRITPFIESLNVSSEMRDMCSRFEELLDYAEAKELKHKAREETGMSQSMRIDKERRENAAAMREQQDAEADENLKDQMEAAADREAERSRKERGATKEEDEAALEEENAGREPS